MTRYASSTEGEKMILDPRLSSKQWDFVYRAWTLRLYGAQVFGVIWILWGGGLTVWLLSTQDLSKLTALAMLILFGVLGVPSAIMFFGGGRLRAWVRKRSAALQMGRAD